jgi:carbonic anhydrase
MSVIDDVLKANEDYTRNFAHGDLRMPPARKLAVVACMDARLTVEEMLDLKTGDAHIIRNAGGIITEDALRSLLISHYLLGTQEFMIINHTDCGMLTFTDEELLRRLRQKTGTAVVTPSHFYAFDDARENVQEQVQKLKAHPWVPKQIAVRGFVYDVHSGRLTEVSSGSRAAAHRPVDARRAA